MTLSDLLARFEDVEETADGWLVHCPAHPDSNASLRISVSETGKVLVKCRARCETTDVVAALGLSMADVASMTPDVRPTRTASAADVPASVEDVAALAARLDKWHAALLKALDVEGWEPPARQAFDYAVRRFGATREDVERLGLGYATDLPGGPRLVVPFRDAEGVPRGFQARALAPEAPVRWLGPKNPEGANWTKVAYFPGAAGWEEVLITEGPGDAITSSVLGYDTICIRGAGLASNPAVVEQVLDLLGDREPVIAGDGDPAGERFSTTLAQALARKGRTVRLLTVPDGEDLTSWRERDPEAAPRRIIKAVIEAKVVAAHEAPLLQWDEARYALTDLGAARFLVDYAKAQGSGIKFTREAGFLLLDDGVWRVDDRQSVRTMAHAVADVVRRVAQAARKIAENVNVSDEERAANEKRAKRFGAFAVHVQGTRGITAMLKEAQAVDGVPASINDFDTHPDLLACRNGVIDLRTGALRPHDPSLLLSRRVDLDYDPEAVAPRWLRFLDEVFPNNPEMPAYMRRLVGYGITGHTTEQVFCIHLGSGANGKSVFLDTLTEVFREITVTTPFSTFEVKPNGGIPNDVAALKGARQVMASEGEQGKRMAESVLKRVTGRDAIAARFMRQEYFEFHATFLLHLATNVKPQFRGQDEGLWRRVKLIKWERYFAPHERDPYLEEKMLREAQGILAWAVQGAREWYTQRLADPPCVERESKAYREASNILDGFLPGRFVVDRAAHDDTILGVTLWEAFIEWADEENIRELRNWTRRAFYAALVERGARQVRHSQGMAFGRIRRATPEDFAEEPQVHESECVSPSSNEGSSLSGASLDDVL